jgi:hypothetical protein
MSDEVAGQSVRPQTADRAELIRVHRKTYAAGGGGGKMHPGVLSVSMAVALHHQCLCWQERNGRFAFYGFHADTAAAHEALHVILTHMDAALRRLRDAEPAMAGAERGAAVRASFYKGVGGALYQQVAAAQASSAERTASRRARVELEYQHYLQRTGHNDTSSHAPLAPVSCDAAFAQGLTVGARIAAELIGDAEPVHRPLAAEPIAPIRSMEGPPPTTGERVRHGLARRLWSRGT